MLAADGARQWWSLTDLKPGHDLIGHFQMLPRETVPGRDIGRGEHELRVCLQSSAGAHHHGALFERDRA
jgi:hypothetical protein